VWSVHCHNDLGMAVANSLAAVRIGGARQIECTVNGLGERAGNTSLEEVVMALRTRKDFFNLSTNIDTTQIVPASRLVSQITGFVVQPNKAVVGANAFAHASGIHQDGVFKARETYEIMTAEDVGWSANKIVLGKLSGRTAFKQRMKELGVELESDDAYNKAFQRFKDLADKKAEIFDEDLLALVAQEAGASGEEEWGLVSMEQGSSTTDKPHASIVLLNKNSKVNATANGDGPVDATFKAIESVAKSGAELLLFSVNAVTQGTESQGEVTVRLSKGGRIVNGVGADTDIVVASAKAYISALNKLASKMERVNPQHQL
jgi:2-isopropylmalate synthase